MLHDLVLEGEFFAMLLGLDAQIAARVAAGRCPHCQGPLHQANYQRKPRGAAQAQLGEAFTVRHSLCCGREGCRKRALPPSLRFLGRRVYLEAVVLLASALAAVAASLREASLAAAVPARTLRRWSVWWTGAFVALPVWQQLRGLFVPPPPDDDALPGALLDRLQSELRTRAANASVADTLLWTACWLAPVTTASVSCATRFVRGMGPMLSPS
jgi:hypothetical protein